MVVGAHSLVAVGVIVCIAGVSHGIQDLATPSPRLSLHPTQHALGSPGRQQRMLRLRGGQLGQGGGQTPRGVHSQFKSFVDDNLSADARKEVGYTCLGLGAGLFVLVLIPLPIIGVFMNRTGLLFANALVFLGGLLLSSPSSAKSFFFSRKRRASTCLMAFGIVLIYKGWCLAGFIMEALGVCNASGPFLKYVTPLIPGGLGAMIKTAGGMAGSFWPFGSRKEGASAESGFD